MSPPSRVRYLSSSYSIPRPILPARLTADNRRPARDTLVMDTHAAAHALEPTDGPIMPEELQLASRNRGMPLEALRWAINVGVDPVPIADALADGVRTVVRVAAAGRGNPYQLASTLGMPAWKIEKAQRQARGWTPDALVLAMRAAADCNAAVKGGEEDRDYALERTIVAFAQAKRAGGRRSRRRRSEARGRCNRSCGWSRARSLRSPACPTS